MAATNVSRVLGAAALLVFPALLSAQQPAKPPAGAPPAAPAPEPKLVFDREVFSYQGSGRRDPFKPLIGKESLGPLFDDLALKGIIYSTDPNRSIVLIQDGSKRLYRIKRGEVIGNSRVVEINPTTARFAVENFGMIRYQVLELRRNPNAAAPAPDAAATPAANARQTVDSVTNARRDSTPNPSNEPSPSNRRPDR